MKRCSNLIVLLIVMFHLRSSTEAKHQSCVVTSSNVTVPWVWPQMLLTAWIPPKQVSENSLSDDILKLHIHFANEDPASTHDIVHIFYNNVTLISTRNNLTTTEFSPIILPEDVGGWLNITFEIRERYFLRRTGSKDEIFSKELEKPFQNVQEVIISGSNVTINCDSDQLIWRITGPREVVPLTPGGRGWRFGMYTTGTILASFILGGASFDLGWENENLSANTSMPLKPFTQYQFFIECLISRLTCYVKNGTTVLKELEALSMPSHLEVDAGEEAAFFFMQKTVPLPQLLPDITETMEPATVPSATIPPAGGGDGGINSGSGDGGSSVGGGGSHSIPGWSGWWAALVVILTFLLIFVIIMCFISHYHRPKIERYLENMNLISEASQEYLDRTPLPERRPLLARSCSIIVDVEDPNTTAPLRLWNAVASGETEEVEQVLATMTPNPESMLEGWDTSPYEEAHRRGYYHVLKALDAFMKRQPQLPDNDLIISVMQSHARSVEAVFEAARGGQYRHGGGVDVLLRAHSLPGTVHDEHGHSLLHYAASVKLADGGPLWLAPDIRSLVEIHNVYVNAVNYKGQTALHALAEKASMSDQNTCWDGKAVNVSQAWVNLATLIMRLGCDPRVADYNNQCPDEVARINCNHPLAEEMEKERVILGEINYSKSLVRFKNFLDAAKLGQVGKMQALLREGVNVLPLGSRSDPLQEAIQGGNRDAVFLLLSAGAPLCAHGLVGETSFEASHKTPGLPALFPALIRRAVCGRLKFEMNIIRNSNEIPDIVKKGAKDIKSIIEKSGHNLSAELSKWMSQQPADSMQNFNEMLAASASSGLTLICQLMGVTGVRLNPLLNDKQPLLLALNANHHNTVYTLCRDLKMNPYSVGCSQNDISEQLSNDLLQSELIAFEKKLRKAGLDEVTVGNLLNYANAISESGIVNKPSKVFLYLLGELSLVTLLHSTRTACSDLSIDTVVHEASGSTIFHIAAAYGRNNMVEYLLSVGADHACKTTQGLMASHLAASRGHKECMQYIIDYVGSAGKCSFGILPQQILSNFDDNIKSYHLDLLSVTDSNAISSAKEDYTKTKLILSSRCSKNGITTEKCLKDAIWKEQRSIRELLSEDFVTLVESDATGFLQEIARIDNRFSGNTISRNPILEKTAFFIPDTFEFHQELEDCHALNEEALLLKKNSKPEKEWDCIDSLKSSKDQEFFNGSNFRYAFYKAAQEALKSFPFQSIALVPPFLTLTSIGISVHGLHRKKFKTHLVQLLLSPVLKVPCQPESALHRRFQHLVQFSAHEHLANSDNNWVYLSNMSYKSALSALTEEEFMVLWTCLYFTKLLTTCWWLPRRQQRRVGCSWQTYPTGVDFPSSRTLLALFFEELSETKEGTWKKENLIERVIAILRRASPNGKRKVSFLTPLGNPPLNSISAIIHFLESLTLANGSDITEDAQSGTKVLGKYGKTSKAVSKTSLNVELE